MALEQSSIQLQFLGGSFSAKSLFCGLSPNTLQSLADITQTKQFKKDTIVIEQGELPGIYVLTQGRANIVLFNHLNQQKMIQTIDQKEIIGLVETMADRPFNIKVKTLSPCLFEFIEKKEFISFLDNQPEVCFQLVKLLGLDLNDSYKAFSAIAF